MLCMAKLRSLSSTAEMVLGSIVQGSAVCKLALDGLGSVLTGVTCAGICVGETPLDASEYQIAIIT